MHCGQEGNATMVWGAVSWFSTWLELDTNACGVLSIQDDTTKN